MHRLLPLLAACGAPAEEGPMVDLFSFVVVADPHLTTPSERDDRLAGVVDWINAEADARDLQLVVVVGDIGWDGGLQAARELFDQLTMPYLPILGDNEIHFGDEHTFDDVFTDHYAHLGTILEDFHRGPIETWNPEHEKTSWFQNFSFLHQGVRFVGLDWSSRSDHVMLGEQADLHDFDGGTWPWFSGELDDLDDTDAEDVFLFSHHAMHLSPGAFSVDEMEQIRGLTGPIGGRVRASWAGHYHFDMEDTEVVGGYDVFVTDATWDDDNTVRVVRVQGNGVRYTIDQELVIVPWEPAG